MAGPPAADDAGRAGQAALDVRGLAWRRLSSVLPAYFTEELIELIVGERRICRHLHVPLQSGSDRVLRGMRRPYTARMYRTLVERLGAAIPGLGLGADLIAGFPGETDADFEATAALVEVLPFSYLHVFSYSDRRGTEAARGSASRIAPGTIRQRTARLRTLAPRSRRLPPRPDGPGLLALVLERRERRRDGWSVSPTTTWTRLPGRTRSCATACRATGQDAEGWKGCSSACVSRVGIIGGRTCGWRAHRRAVAPRGTPFGDPSDATIGRLGDRAVVFLPQRSRATLIPRAAHPSEPLRDEGARRRWVISVSAVEHARADRAARPRHPRPVLRQHEAPHPRSSRRIVARVSMAVGLPRPGGGAQAASVETGDVTRRHIPYRGPAVLDEGRIPDLPELGRRRNRDDERPRGEAGARGGALLRHARSRH